MKTIAIYCASLKMGGQTFDYPRYWNAYSELLLKLQGRGVEAYFVTGSDYLGDGVFAYGYTMFKPGQPDDLIPVPLIKADIVFDRGGFSAPDVRVINPPDVFRLGADKTAMYETFGQFQVPSAVCRDRRELEAALGRLKTELVVVKDPTGSGGFGVHIGTRAEVLGKITRAKYPLLVQKFMDTSGGIPGIVEGIHDMRFIMLEGQILSADVRTPKPGEYRANVAQGGVARYIPLPRVPAAAGRLARRIDATFGQSERFYAIDIARSSRGWKLIELNAHPGLIPSSESPANALIMRRLTSYLVQAARRVPAPQPAWYSGIVEVNQY